MIMIHFKNYRYLFFLTLAIGLLGAVFFFPMQINSRYTCLYHRVFQADHNQNKMRQPLSNNPIGILKGDDDQQANAVERNRANGINYDGNEIKANHTNSHHTIAELHSSELLERYIHGYAWFWWGSILLLTFGFYLGKNKSHFGKKK